MMASLPKEKTVTKVQNTSGYPALSRNTVQELLRAGINPSNLSHQNYTRRAFGGSNNSRNNTKKNTKTILAKKFQDSYQFMKSWVSKIESWAEAGPALYRSVLLFVKQNTPGASNASFICVDEWSMRTMRDIHPFAALEALYYDNDDGTASFTNKEKLYNLVDDFRKVLVQKAGTASRVGQTFEDIIMPPLPDKFMSDFCSKRNAQGEFVLESQYVTILEKAQAEIIALYNTHLDTCFSILNEIFDQVKNSRGETTIKFTQAFSTNTSGARAALEAIIERARGQIASHYIQVETIYHKAINDMILFNR
jgi:hypothetical protein